MPAGFRVAYFDRPMHRVFTDLLSAAPGIVLLRLDSSAPVEGTIAELATCHGLAVSAATSDLPAHWNVRSPLLAQLPGLLMVASFGAGYDTIDVDACTAAGVIVCNQAGGNARGVAEHALGMILSLLKRIPESHVALRASGVRHRDELMGRELGDRTVGIVGLGHTGTQLATLLRAFGCEVLACDPLLDNATCAARGARKVTLSELLGASDVVSVHCPLLPSTRGMFDAAALAQMRDGAILVTTARGHIHDEAAVLDALNSGRLAGAGLDVWVEEPPAASTPLLAHPRVIATPHTAGVTHESRERGGRMSAEVFVEAAHGRVPPRVLNPQVSAVFERRLAVARITTTPG